MSNSNPVTRTAEGTPQQQAQQRGARSEPAILPPVDVVEDGAGITLYADLPGVPKDKLVVHVEGETLHIDADIVLTLPQEMQSNHAEVQRTHYRRAFTLSRELDPEKVSAELNQGVLTVRIPKAEHAKPRRVEVQVA